MMTAPYSPKARSHARTIPARIPGAASGSATWRNRESSEWPSVAAMSSVAGSMLANADLAATMRKGAAQKVWARTMPARELVKCPSNS